MRIFRTKRLLPRVAETDSSHQTGCCLAVLVALFLKKAMNFLNAYFSTNRLSGVAKLTEEWTPHITRVDVSQSWQLLVLKGNELDAINLG
jgi:hypothetical protein